MERLKTWIARVSNWCNWVSAASAIAMMLLTCADVILRIFRRPIPGTYEIVGLLGAVFVSFALAQTSIERGHIAVEFIVQRLPRKAQNVVECINALICGVLFSLITWQSIAYADDLKTFGEVSMTLQMPIYPFVYGIAIGCGMLSLVLLMRFVDTVTQLDVYHY